MSVIRFKLKELQVITEKNDFLRLEYLFQVFDLISKLGSIIVVAPSKRQDYKSAAAMTL